MILVNNIRKIMTSKNLKDTHIGNYLSITRQAANAKLNGHRQFTVKDVQILKEALNVTYDELLKDMGV